MPYGAWRPPCSGRTSVYRLFNADGVLLYIGVSNAPRSRYRQHQKQQPWGDEIASRTVEWFDTRLEALRVELAAIRVEQPRYNVVYATAPPALPVAPKVEPAIVDLAEAKVALLGVLAQYKTDLARAREVRDEKIRRIAAKYDLKQVEIIRTTGYSRETVRQALNPEVRAAVKKAAEDRRNVKEG